MADSRTPLVPDLAALAKLLANLPRFQPIPTFTPNIPKFNIPSPEERDAYQSAASLVDRMARRIDAWKTALPLDQQPAIIAVLPNGLSIRVSVLASDGHHGVVIQGDSQNGPCMLVAHQATLQLLCFVEQVDDEEQRRPIGFNTAWDTPDPEAQIGTDTSNSR
jgi:hypothetical protein